MDIADVSDWLEQGEEWGAAAILSECEFAYDYVDTAFPFDGSPAVDVCELRILAPRRVLDRVAGDLRKHVAAIENAVVAIARTQDCWVREVHWLPRLRASTGAASDEEVEHALAKLDAEHVRAAWAKALSRRRSDPAGAITAAKTLIECVCKQILRDGGVEYPPNPDATTLYHLAAEHLDLAASQQLDQMAKRVLGNCQAVIQGVALLRNRLGDAHAKDPDDGTTPVEYGELAVNLAGAMAIFLARAWERAKAEKTEQSLATDAQKCARR